MSQYKQGYPVNKEQIHVMIEYLLFNDKLAIFQIYDGENKLHFDEMMTMSTLY
jgi:hypothetical protein